MTDCIRDTPREVLAQRMPAVAQPFITWLSGIPFVGQTPARKRTSIGVIGLALLLIAVGWAVIWSALSQPGPISVALYLVGFVCVAGGVRRLDVLIIHQTLHAKVLHSARGDYWLGEFLTTVLLRTPYFENRKEHLGHHRSPCDEDDADVLYLKSAGVTLANSPLQLFLCIVGICLSPAFHLRFIRSRLLANFVTARPLYRLGMSWAYAAALAAPTLWFGAAYVKCLALFWLLPLWIGFQISNFLYTTTKHRWWVFSNQAIRGAQKRDLLSYTRVCCSEMPINATPPNMVAWWLKALFVHVPTRLFVVVGDTVHHDLHHIAPNCDWPNSSLERSHYQAKTPERFSEVWGGIFAHMCECNLTVSVLNALDTVAEQEAPLFQTPNQSTQNAA